MTNAQTIKSALTSAATLLNTEAASLEAQLLLQHVLNVNRAWLIAHEGDALQANKHAVFEALLTRRLHGEPIAYILGYREFYGLKLKVSADTLIPRADTETLVEAALARVPPSPQPSPAGRGSDGQCAEVKNNAAESGSDPLRGNDGDGGSNNSKCNQSRAPRNLALSSLSLRERAEGEGYNATLLDLGTGTGAIALALAHKRPQAFVTATDASVSALKIAQENAQNLGITNIKFIKSDWFGALQNEKFDLIVSNPPYIMQDDIHLKQGDLRFEPLSALASGAGGLDDIKQIIAHAPQHLNPYGWLLLEHGYDQAESVSALLKSAGFSEIETVKDLGGNDRVTLGLLQNSNKILNRHSERSEESS